MFPVPRLNFVALACLALCGCRTVEARQRDYPHPLEPAKLEVAAPVAADRPLRALKVRAWLDDDFRAQILHSDERIRRMFARASEVLGPALGVKLELVEQKNWSHRGGGTLDEPLEALEKLDPGDDVDLVIGFTSALPVFSG